jgi:hypothetical protein
MASNSNNVTVNEPKCLICSKYFALEELKTPCECKDHYYCDDCFQYGISMMNEFEKDLDCILCDKVMIEYKFPNKLMKYNNDNNDNNNNNVKNIDINYSLTTLPINLSEDFNQEIDIQDDEEIDINFENIQECSICLEQN